MGKLEEVADSVWVQQSEWVWTNSIVVRSGEGLIVIDPGITGAELDGLADALDQLGMPVVAGFSTHPHFDHLLWHPRFGDVPRYASVVGAQRATEARELAREAAVENAPDMSDEVAEVVADVTPLPADGGPIPGQIIEHEAHSAGHLAIFLEDRGVLIAGDMFSDVLVPLFDHRQDDQLGAYETAFDRLEGAVGKADVLIPGHGSVAKGDEVGPRLAADRAYIAALRSGEDPVDPRLEQDWLFNGPHQGNLKAAEASRS